MRVLLTGASSFTGLWIARALAASGVEVVAPLRGSVASYAGVRAERVAQLAQVAEIAPECVFGGERFLACAARGRYDALCHHAAEVGDYRSADFDVAGALAANTRQLRPTLETLARNGLKAVLATGSVFEPDEGTGDPPLRAFSPYGVSKALTWQVVRYCAEALGLAVGKFVIANPFGAYEEPRFCAYLIGAWLRGDTPQVRTPLYLRDNIHVELLATTYARFVRETVETGAGRRFGPRGYVETQGAFAERLAREMRPRLGKACRLEVLQQTTFAEPRARANLDALDPSAFDWDDNRAWDEMARYYLRERDR